MAALKHLRLFLEFEPIVKLACWNENCQFNLMNASNSVDERMAACNLKQITIGDKGQCENFKPIEKTKDEN